MKKTLNGEKMNNFKTLLEWSGMTAYQLSKKTGITQSTLSDLKSGKKDFKNLTVSNAAKIAKALGTTVEDMLLEEGKDMNKIYIQKINLTINEFIDRYQGNVGYVYPAFEDSYYIGSNLGANLQPVELIDGMLFADDSMDELAAQGYPAVCRLYDHDAYQTAVETYNASIGQDNRPVYPSKGMFAVEYGKPTEFEDLDLTEALQINE